MRNLAKTKNQRANKLNALIIFIKNPKLGNVKTRLAETVGNEDALKIYKSLLSYTRVVSSLTTANRYLYYDSEIIEDEWPVELYKKKLQSDSKDLGVRMSNAFKEVLSENDKAIIIGSDCAQLEPSVISKAFQALDTKDVVIGPSLDGGYYLLGMKTFHESLFLDMNWSTDQVFPRTLDKLNNQNLSYHTLAALSDIDYEEDWDEYGWKI